MPLVSGNINRLKIFEGVSCWGVVKPEWCRWNRLIYRFPIAISSYVSEITSALIEHYNHTPFWISASTKQGWPAKTLNARFKLTCVHCMSHGLLADSVDTSSASLFVQQMWCSVKCTISERAEKEVCSWRAVSLLCSVVEQRSPVISHHTQ